MVVRIRLNMMKSITTSLLWSSNGNVNSALTFTLPLFSLSYFFNAMQCISLDISEYLFQHFQNRGCFLFCSWSTSTYIRGSRIP